jgi:hypothetical protein
MEAIPMIDNTLDRLMDLIEMWTRVVSGLALWWFKGKFVTLR